MVYKPRRLFLTVITGLVALVLLSCLSRCVNIYKHTSLVKEYFKVYMDGQDSSDSLTMTPCKVDVRDNKIYPESRVTYCKKSQRYVPLTWVQELDYNSTIHTRHSDMEYRFLTIRMDKFQYAIKNPRLLQEKCSDAEMLIYVHTSTVNREKRRVIRENWGVDVKKSHVKIAVVFVVGESGNSTVNRLLEKENEQYSDIIQGAFLDKYDYMTIKSLMAISWVRKYCSHVAKIVKVDDDIFINVPQLVKFYADDLPKLKLKTDKVIACSVIKNARVMRFKTTSHYVPYDEYADEHFPNYCTGLVFMMYNTTVRALYTAAYNQEYFYIDDVLLTGFLAKKIGATHLDIRHRVRNEEQKLPKINANTIFFNLWQIQQQSRTQYIERVHSYNNATIQLNKKLVNKKSLNKKPLNKKPLNKKPLNKA